MSFLVGSPLRDLVAQNLRPSHKARGVLETHEVTLATFDAASPLGAEALAGSGAGLDLFRGERVLAAAFMYDQPKEWAEHRLSLAITDEKTVLSGWSSITGVGTLNDRRFVVPHAELARVTRTKSLLANSVNLHGARGTSELTFPNVQDTLAWFFEQLVRLPPEHRRTPPTPFVEGATSLLWSPDPGAQALLDAASREGPEAQRDLVPRAVLAHRARVAGPGMHQGWWVSPLYAPDLGHTFVRVFGPPRAHAVVSPGVEQLDFDLPPGRDLVSAGEVAFGVAAFAAIGSARSLGSSIAKGLRKKLPVSSIRLVFGDQGGHTGYQLYAWQKTLEHADAFLAHSIHRLVAAAAYDVLTRRMQRGWQAPYPALFA